MVAHPTSTTWTEKGRRISHSSALCPDHKMLLLSPNGFVIPPEMSAAEQELHAPQLIGTMFLVNKPSVRREIQP